MSKSNKDIKLSKEIEEMDRIDVFMSKILELDIKTIMSGAKALIHIFPMLKEN